MTRKPDELGRKAGCGECGGQSAPKDWGTRLRSAHAAPVEEYGHRPARRLSRPLAAKQRPELPDDPGQIVLSRHHPPDGLVCGRGLISQRRKSNRGMTPACDFRQRERHSASWPAAESCSWSAAGSWSCCSCAGSGSGAGMTRNASSGVLRREIDAATSLRSLPLTAISLVR